MIISKRKVCINYQNRKKIQAHRPWWSPEYSTLVEKSHKLLYNSNRCTVYWFVRRFHRSIFFAVNEFFPQNKANILLHKFLSNVLYLTYRGMFFNGKVWRLFSLKLLEFTLHIHICNCHKNDRQLTVLMAA